MKLNGQSLNSSFTQTFSLPRPQGEPLVLRLRPLPLGFHQRLRRRGLTPPVPPAKVARDSSGKILRDSTGQVVTHADETQVEFLNAVELYHQRVAVLSIAESLRDDPRLSFETPCPSSDAGWPEYADALFLEMESSGLTTGDLVRLCREICRLSNLLNAHCEMEQGNFSCPGPVDSR